MSNSNIIAYTLDVDNPCNTQIKDGAGNVVYVVHTNTGDKRSTTTVYDASENVIAECVWGTVDSAAEVIFKGGEKTTMGRWMKESKMPFNHDVHFTDDQGRKYKWKGNEPEIGVSLKLYAAEDEHTAIAGFEKLIKSNEKAGLQGRPARLLFLPRALEIRDLVVASFLFLERAIRTKANDGRVYTSLMGGDLGGAAMIGLAKSGALR